MRMWLGLRFRSEAVLPADIIGIVLAGTVVLSRTRPTPALAG
jgi:hypothetical protein